MKTKIIVVVGLVAVLAVLGWFFPRPNPVTKEVVREIRELGAIPGNEVQGNEFTVGGVKHISLVPEGGGPVASTTPCTLKSPNATTSMDVLTLNWNGAFATTSSGAATTIIDIATSTTRNATTSLLWSVPVSPGVAFHLALNATNSPNGTSNYILPPNTFVNIGVRGNDAVTRPGGQCQIDGIQL